MSRKLQVVVMILVAGSAAAWPAIAVSAQKTTYYGNIGSSDGTMSITAQPTGRKGCGDHQDQCLQPADEVQHAKHRGLVQREHVMVTNHKFKSVRHYSAAQGGPGTATTIGTVSSNNKTITGTTQYKGTEGPYTGCNTGKQTYKAAKQ